MQSTLLGQAALYDPNWFLSTTVQSTAALVAIIGGFLISRLISTISEKSGLLHHLADLENRKRISQSANDYARRKIQVRTNDWFLDEHLKEIIKTKGSLDIAKLAEDFWGRGHDQPLTQQYGQKLADITARAFKEIPEIYGPNENPPVNCDDLRNAGLLIQGYEEEKIFEGVAESLAKTKPVKSAFGVFNFPQNPMGGLIMPVITPAHVQARHDANIANELDLKTSISFIDGEISLIKSKLPALTNPKPFIWGFIVLAYFGGVGIFYPLYYMTNNPVLTPTGIRTNVYFGFLSGFIVLLLYIANDVVKLRDISKANSDPT